MSGHVVDGLLELRDTFKGRVNHEKGSVRYWHKVMTTTQNRYLKLTSRIRYTHAVLLLTTSFEDLRMVKKLIEEAQNDIA